MLYETRCVVMTEQRDSSARTKENIWTSGGMQSGMKKEN